MTVATRIRKRLVADLASAIETHRDDIPARDLAGALLDWDGGHRSLLGLEADCRRACYFDETVSLIHSFPVPETEITARKDVRSHRAGRRIDAWAFVVQQESDWDWVHPRYRWLLDGGFLDGA